MSTNPITSETSLKSHPTLRVGLIALWVVVAAYTFIVMGIMVSPKIVGLLNTSLMQTILNIPALFQLVLGFGTDFLVVLGFSVIGGLLVVRRSDDWFAIFTSLFLITFGARVTNQMNILATIPGYETLAGLVLAMGDIGIVLFLMLFPNGKFANRWFKFSVPLLVISAFAIYTIPAAPFFWQNMQSPIIYFAITSIWYLTGLLAIGYRYFSHATLAQKQQIRWIMIGALGPFLWYMIFEVAAAFIPQLSATATITGASFHAVANLLSIFMFLSLPFSIIISIVRSRLFDIDLIINRSLVYGTLTFGLVLAFAGMLGLISLVFQHFHQGEQSLLAASVFSVAAGALFQPARKRLQRFVDRAFYHIQIDYQKTPAKLPSRPEASTGITNLSAYQELKLIARGGMAEIYRATSPTTGKPVAIKILPATLATDDQFRRRFLREAEIVSGLHHDNIVRIIDFGDENGAYYIVMEYLSGPDLSNLLKQEKRIALPEVVIMLREIGAALDYAHGRGLVHRDIKPSNVMMDSSSGSSRAVLTDFGIAKITDAHTRITMTGVLGTFDYIAPEQIQASAEVDSRADLYALGVMTYQMLTGHLPFERPNTGALLLAHISAPPPDARELVHDLPRHISYALQRAMSKKPKDRYATAQEFVTALESA
jgi:tRNA A-37 threonylcarbamoyl transferase component Bud32